LAIVRELVTILGTELNDKGIKDYEHGIERIKEIALGAASAIGIAFSVEKISEFIEGILDSGKEINKIRAQIANIARPMDDVNEAMSRTFDIAQEIGVAYTGVADTFRDFLQSSRDSTISQEELLAVTENLYKATKADRLSAENQSQLMSIIRRVDVIGKASPRIIGMLQNTSISALNLLRDYFHTDEEGLRALAKAGKITFEEFTKALGKTNAELNAKFAALPWTFGRGWEYARNQMVYAASEFIKVTRLSIIFGTAIKWLTDQIVSMFKAFFNAVGGAKNAMEVLGIAMALVLGPRMLAYLIDMVAWMWRFTAANWAAILPWAAMAAAVVAVAVAIQDLVYWIQGKRSAIGTWVGSFKELKESFASLDIFSGFRAIGDIFKGDWKGAWEELKTAIGDVNAIILVVIASIALVKAGFLAWNLLEFTGVIAAVKNLINVIKGVPVAAKEAEAATEALAAGAGKGKASAPVVAPGSAPAVAGGKGLSTLGMLWRNLGLWFTLATTLHSDTPELSPEDKAKLDERNRQEAEDYKKKYPNYDPNKAKTIGQAFHDLFVPPVPTAPTPGAVPTVPSIPGIGQFDEYGRPIPTINVTPSGKSAWQGFKDTFSYLTPGMGAVGAAINPPAAAIGPPVAAPVTNNDNKQISLNQTNTVTVQVQDDSGLASRIAKSIGDFTGEVFSGIARDLGRSSPRTETATQ
jgi:hypothetical protein